MAHKIALISGITGQDGSYLAEFLLDKGYEVFGFMRRSSTEPLLRIEQLVLDKKIKLINGNMRDLTTIEEALKESQPHEIYNLAAQSDVGISFDCPDETLDVNCYGLAKLVDTVIELGLNSRIYQASTSEMFGSTPPPQNEQSDFSPVSPYAKAKLRAHEKYVVGYRERYGLFICSGILFNHESPRRGKHFVTRKITHSLAKIKLGLQECLELGSLEARRDWGFAGDYVEAMWLMLRHYEPDDFVIATGENHSVEEFVDAAAKFLGIKILWQGEGLNRVGINYYGGKTIVRVNPQFYRPSEIKNLLGDSQKARTVLGWKPKMTFDQLVESMVLADLALVRSQSQM